MGLTLVFWDPFLSFFSYDLINTHDIGHTSVYGLEIALHSLQLLNRALLYMRYFNGFKQTNKHTHTPQNTFSFLLQHHGPLWRPLHLPRRRCSCTH